jgi:hypothetical protein
MNQDLRADNLPKESPEGDKSVPEDFGGEAESTGASSCERGMSNTPASCTTHCCIDYVKIRFDRSFDFADAAFQKLFKILKLDINGFLILPGFSGYETTYQWDEGVFISTGGNSTRCRIGEETSILEMKGHACRLFEERVSLADDFEGNSPFAQIAIYSAWNAFCQLCIEMGCHCRRLDLPTDDLGGLVPFAELHDKILNKEYTTNLRSFALDDTFPKNADHARVKESCKLAAFSATFGGTDKIQLCIYNKIAERLVHGGTINTPYWMRYEARFFHDTADLAFLGMADAIQKGEFNSFCARVLAGLICFKDPGKRSADTMRNAKPWETWTNFLKDASAIKFSDGDDDESTLECQAKWLARDAEKVLARLAAYYSLDFINVIKFLVLEGLNNLQVEDLTIVNNFLATKRRPPFACLNDLIKSGQAFSGMVASVSGETRGLFENPMAKKEKKTKGNGAPVNVSEA